MSLPTIYRIVVAGHLPERWSELLHGMQVQCGAEGDTTLIGPLRDQAELYGLVAKLQSLGLTLVSINPKEGGG